jgi:TPR repeat protein
MANLADLVLLRNVPAVAEEFLQAASEGDVDAQYGMGLIYAEGRGVEQDEARAFYWLTRAIEQGDTGAAVLRQVVAVNMTDAQFAEAQLLIKAFHASGHAASGPGRRGRRKQRSRTALH